MAEVRRHMRARVALCVWAFCCPPVPDGALADEAELESTGIQCFCESSQLVPEGTQLDPCGLGTIKYPLREVMNREGEKSRTSGFRVLFLLASLQNTEKKSLYLKSFSALCFQTKQSTDWPSMKVTRRERELLIG